jgi:hypothetical protein
MIYQILVGIIGLYFIILALTLKTSNTQSYFVFKIIPGLSGGFLVIYAMWLMGWVIRIN